MLRRLLLRWLVDAMAVYAAIELIPGIVAGEGWGILFWVALILGLVNALIAPLLRLLTCPLIILSLGLFTLVINALMLRLTATIATAVGLEFVVTDWVAAFLGALVISVVSVILSVVLGVDRKRRRR